MPEIRRLDEREDLALLKTAWGWRDDAPKWFVDTLNSEDETFEDFISTAEEELIYGIFDEDLTAVVRMVSRGNGVFELHLMARRKTDWEVLAQGCRSIKQYLFDNKIVRLFYGWIPVRNKGIVRLYQSLGFNHSGEKCYKGQMRGRPIKWLLFCSQNY